MIVKGMREILDLLFPRVCMLCRSPVGDEHASWICGDCQDDFSPILNACARCGAPLGDPSPVSVARQPTKRKLPHCAFCKGQQWDFGRAWSYTIYHSTASRAVRLMKESHGEPLTRSIGDLLGQWLQSQESFKPEVYDAIVPIPQHWFRRLTHRYNQATTLGERVAHRLNMRCSESILRRSRWTQKQGMKTISERRENLLEAFEVPKPQGVRYRSFLLIDDVMTSGATLQEAARALRAAGARRVDAVVFARGVNAPKLPGSAKTVFAAKEDLTFDQNISEPQGSGNEELRRKIH
ncbi:MAG: ComF family protein [Pirellula sp.]